MILDTIELLKRGSVQLRWIKVLYDGEGNEVEAGYHRYVVTPGDDISMLPDDTQASINAHWTVERIASWNAIKRTI